MKQFDWSRNWKKVEPHLCDSDVQAALDFGMNKMTLRWKRGDAPWKLGRGPLNGQRAIVGKLSWYQPWGRCHWIAPFAWAIGKKIYPDLQWGVLTSTLHSVAIGLRGEEIDVVSDILNFKSYSAEDSLSAVKKQPWDLRFSMEDML